MERDILLQMLKEDSLGLLTCKATASPRLSADERLVSGFKEIIEFFAQTGRAPEANAEDLREFQLYSRLSSLRNNMEKSNALKEIDEFGLLQHIENARTISDVFDTDNLGLLNNDPEDIFKLRHVPARSTVGDEVAHRKPCKDFHRFESLFNQCHSDLLSGLRTSQKFTSEQQIKAGRFFIVQGITVYIAEMGKMDIRRRRPNARLRCIFENGTESNMLLRSLSTALFKDEAGRIIVDPKCNEENELIDVTDRETGFVYILSSLSEIPEIRSLSNLFKIGYSSFSMAERLKNAPKEPTYLMAPVEVVATYRCVNLNPQKVEQVLHAFFDSTCLSIEVRDSNGKAHMPREWFIAPLDIIEEAIQKLIDGSIVHFKYDPDHNKIIPK